MIRLIIAFLFLFNSQELYAFTCRDTSGNVIDPSGGTASIYVTVGPNLVEGKNMLADLASQISCKNDVWEIPDWTDFLKTEPNGLHMYPALKEVVGGVTIKGIDYDNPIPSVSVYSIPSNQTAPLPMKIYIRVHDYPTNPVVIHKGDMLAKIDFRQTNNHHENDDKVYSWKFLAANDAGILTSSCTINNGQAIDVPFGKIRSDFITNNPEEASIRIDKSLTYHCNRAVTQDISIKLYADVSTFSSQAIKSTNKDVGIVMMRNEKVVSPNTSFNTTLINGQGADTITFVPLKGTSVDALDIASGPFSASAILVMTVN